MDQLKDGPITTTARGCECWHCHHRFTNDIYHYQGMVLCGNCRYRARTGRWPDRTPTTGAKTNHAACHDKTYNGDGGGHFDNEWWMDQIGG